jgi:hypothetical protein
MQLLSSATVSAYISTAEDHCGNAGEGDDAEYDHDARVHRADAIAAHTRTNESATSFHDPMLPAKSGGGTAILLI